MKVKYNRISVEKEIPFDMEYLKDIFDDITTDNCGKIDDEDLLEYIPNHYIFTEQEIKQLPKLYNEWYSKDENCQCREEVNKILDDLCKKYPNEDIKSIVNYYFS